ncbi:MAG: hypothetical protein AMJ75_10615, partial [Phycisphaerae bacterium SM1_79]
MSKKTMSAIAAVVVLAAVGNLIAQKTDNGNDATRTQRERRDVDRPEGDTLAGRERPPIPSTVQEQRILNVLEQMCRGQHSGMLSVP